MKVIDVERVFAAPFGSPEQPIIVLAGGGVKALREDPSTLFPTVDMLGARLDALKILSFRVPAIVVSKPSTPNEDLADQIVIAKVLGADLVDDDPRGPYKVTEVQRPGAQKEPAALHRLPDQYLDLRFPEDGEPDRMNLALALCTIGRVDSGTDLLRKECLERPDDAHVLFQLGYWLLETGAGDEAIEPLERSARLDPDRIEPIETLGIALSATGQYRKACEAFAKSVELDRDNFCAWANLAQAYDSAGNPDAAFQAAKKALALDPRSSHLHALAARIAAKRQDAKEARRLLGEAERLMEVELEDGEVPDVIVGELERARQAVAAIPKKPFWKLLG